jgi:5-(carboxyamino)imidazole ribonucleotide mutase
LIIHNIFAEVSMNKKVAIVMGSDSDFDIVKGALEELDKFGVDYEVKVCSAHRTPYHAAEYAKTAEDMGIGVMIAAAGKAAHLPGVIAAYTTLPVIGLPIRSSFMDGLDSLLSIAQMPDGVPVATVAVNGSRNAAILAVQILAVGNKELSGRLKDHKKEMEEKVIGKDKSLQAKLSGESQ